jgi:hypothetical protein
MNDIKDNLANVTTIAGSGAALMGWNEVLTLVLIVTGIVLNIVRIVTIKKSDK